jgi:hypothetical protein
VKIQVKLDKATLQHFLVNQGEKLAFGLVVVLAALITYLGPGRGDAFNRTPKELTVNVDNLNAIIEQKPPTSLPIAPYASQTSRHGAIDGQPYVAPLVFNPPLFDSKAPRGTPSTYAVEQLRGKGEIAAYFTISAAPKTAPAAAATDTPEPEPKERKRPARPTRAGEEPKPFGQVAAARQEGRIWVSLVGLVPYVKQRDAYRTAFVKSLGYDQLRDQVLYAGYKVERLEISSPGDAVSPDWNKAKKINSLELNPAEEAKKQWPVQVQGQPQTEVVDAKYWWEVPQLVFPLGPLVGRPWGASVAHEPEIPLGIGQMMVPSMLGPPGGLPFGGRGWGRIGAPDASSMPGAPIAPSTPGAPLAPSMPGAPLAPSTPGAPLAPSMPGAPIAPGAPLAPELKPPDYRLFRFLDFDVQPGKYYMYRVCLVLANPNYKLKAALLSNEARKYAENVYLETDWSKPSAVISVPGDTGVLLASVAPPQRSGGESWANVLMTKWSMDKGTEEHKKMSLFRGQIANSGTPTSRTTTARPEYATDSLAVDIRGDERLSKTEHDSTEPAEILLLTAGGNLVVRDEIDDALATAELTVPKVPSPLQPTARGERDRASGFGAGLSDPSGALRRAVEEKKPAQPKTRGR